MFLPKFLFYTKRKRKSLFENGRKTSGYEIILLLLLLMEFLWTVDGGMCYSCAGICHNEQHCNCQIGSCESDYCFIEKKPAEMSGAFRITKGCVNRPARTQIGCDFDHFPNHVQCVCAGDFCNDSILMRRAAFTRRNVTCRECGERAPDCGRTCRGEWCHEKVTGGGGSGCGYGPPALPYFYRGPEVLRHRHKICVTLSRGNAAPHRYCICNTPMCNAYAPTVSAATDSQRSVIFPLSLFGISSAASSTSSVSPPLQHRSRSVNDYYRAAMDGRRGTALSSVAASMPPVYECVNCDLTAEDNSMTSNCKSSRCYGHYCVYATQRVVLNTVAAAGSGGSGLPSAIIHEKQGCMNVTDAAQVQNGCTHKWMNNEEEELYCACRGDLCNVDLATASRSAANRLATAVSLLYYIPLLTVTLLYSSSLS